jgi:hypothetical protein
MLRKAFFLSLSNIWSVNTYRANLPKKKNAIWKSKLTEEKQATAPKLFFFFSLKQKALCGFRKQNTAATMQFRLQRE